MEAALCKPRSNPGHSDPSAPEKITGLLRQTMPRRLTTHSLPLF